MTANQNQLKITKPDDWHLHIRDAEIMKAVLPATYRWASRAIIMPNLVPPIVTGADARLYADRIKDSIESGAEFEPLLTLYLTQDTQAEDVVASYQQGIIKAVKLYPAGATTNSQNGVADIKKVYPVLAAMSEASIPLLIHGEVTDPQIDIFDREAVFIEQILEPLRRELPDLRIVMEHITTKQAASYVLNESRNLGATITPHHLVVNRNVMLAGGIRPHYYCLPILKRESHRLALIDAATKGDKRFFLGTDSAPHLDGAKIDVCGCAGVFNASFAIEILAQLFDNLGALDNLEGFVSLHGADFYRLPYNKQTLRLFKSDTMLEMPKTLQTEEGNITLFDPQMPVYWQILK